MSQMPSASYYISDCCTGLLCFVFGHIMRWHPVKVLLPPSINIWMDHVLPWRAGGRRALLAAALCCRGRFCVGVAHHFLSLVNVGGLCCLSSLIAGHCTSVKSGAGKTLCKETAARKAELEGGAPISGGGGREGGSIRFVWAVTATTNTRLIFAAANLVKPALHKVNARLKKNFCLLPGC